MLASMPLPPISAAIPRERHQQRQDPGQRHPFAQHQPRQQRRPHRHGVGDHDGLAGGKPQQRQSHRGHPDRDIEKRRQQQPRPLIPRHPQTLPARHSETRKHGGAGDPRQAARRQRRPFDQDVLDHRPVEAQQIEVMASNARPDGAMRAWAPGWIWTVME
jgi:hypothetical protein